MNCPECKENKLVSMKHAGTPAGEEPFECAKCGHKITVRAGDEPNREWRLETNHEGQFRLIEVMEGRLVAVGLSTQVEPDVASGEPMRAAGSAESEAKTKFRAVLTGMLTALDKPVVHIKQIVEDV